MCFVLLAYSLISFLVSFAVFAVVHVSTWTTFDGHNL